MLKPHRKSEVRPPRLTRVQMGEKTDVGRVRRRNEDDRGWWVPNDPYEAQRKGYLYLVADGMGGHLAGDRASELAVSAISKVYYEYPSTDVEESLCLAMEAANQRIHEEAMDSTKAKMGTTAVCVVIRGNELYIAHVGDSRAYLARGQAMQRLTQDHSWVEDQVRAGLISQEDARTHPQRNVITRSLGSQAEVAIDTQRRLLQQGDIILLCTDGLSGTVRDEQLQEIILSQEPQAACEQLIATANENGGPDNITAIVIKVEALVPTPQELIPERYRAAAIPLVEQTAVSARPATVPATKRLWGLNRALAGALLVLATVLCLAITRVWGIPLIRPLVSQGTFSAMIAMPSVSPSPRNNNKLPPTAQTVPFAPAPLPSPTATSTPTPPPPSPTMTSTPTSPPPSPTPTETFLPTPTQAPLARPSPTPVPLPPVPTPQVQAVPPPTSTVPQPSASSPVILEARSTAWVPETITAPVSGPTWEEALTMTVLITAPLPITVPPPSLDTASRWTIHITSTPAATFTESVTVDLAVVISSTTLLRGALLLNGEMLSAGQGVEVDIAAGREEGGAEAPAPRFALVVSSAQAEEPAAAEGQPWLTVTVKPGE
jgi:serine/threonine protein phosphatase PrpC